MAPLISMVPKVYDSEIIDLCRSIGNILNATNFEVLTLGGASTLPIGQDADGDSPFRTKDFRLLRASVSGKRFEVVLDRQALAGVDAILYDQLTVSNNAIGTATVKGGVTEEEARAIEDIVFSAFSRDHEKIAGLFRNPKLFRDLLASHHRQNIQLQETVLRIAEQATDARDQLEKDFGRRREALEKDAAVLRQHLIDEAAREKSKNEQSYEGQMSELAERNRVLADREKVLDDRNNTHARRELHKDLKTKIAQRAGSLTVTPETTANRRPIHVAIILSMAFLATSIVFFYWQMGALSSQNTTAQWLIAGLKPVTLTIALLGLLAWYLRWMNRWFERYADTEFQLKQFELDIDRASWVVEAALEWKLSQDRPMPEHLLETISRNLFSKSEKDESADMHPADYLASAILGRASALNLKVPGGEISLTGRDLKRLKTDEISPA
ncbi:MULTISPECIES: hypothetical protein [unclassified Shinella]|uniref:hypothetical protein n=1 Tax=unclassified Shinella TaxID=2643062 RepID=UPI00234FB53F|nr:MULTISPECIES: hypothetical protein [unclassified Shinella]MCO5153403.1 hypothetical protein [Shinella sp.]MDC7260582.1 hypothetical protein [Shinella sp. HY16]MDC7267477.1 hypothetical protein [Shinella sp. YZ44]